jgi:hypothetical protein
MPELTTTEKQGYDTHVAASGNVHNAKLSDLAAPVAALDFGGQDVNSVGRFTGVTGSSACVRAIAPTHKDVNVSVPGDGVSNHTFDIALANGFFYKVDVFIVSVDQTDQSEQFRWAVCLCSAASGSVKILGLDEPIDLVAADSGSIFEGSSSYGEQSSSTSNLRITLAAHASHAVKHSIFAEVTKITKPA